MKIKSLIIYGMLLLASFLIVVSTSCEKEDDDPTPPVENGENGDNGNNNEDFTCGENFTDLRDGNVYPTVKIGNQCWMAENLAYLPEITYADNWGSNAEPQYAVYGYTPGSGTETVDDAKASEHYENYGVLYNWAAAMAGAESSEEKPSGVQGICPPGWHLPSDDEWTELVDYVISQGYANESDSISGAGNALKSCHQIDSPLGANCDTSVHPRWNSHDTHSGFDEFGFNALPGGNRFAVNFDFDGIGRRGHWWCATESSDDHARLMQIYNNSGDVFSTIRSKEIGQSVRCVMD